MHLLCVVTLTQQTKQEGANVFVDNLILKYRFSKEVLTIQETEFLSQVFQNTCRFLKFTQLQAVAHHHETIGSLEATN